MSMTDEPLSTYTDSHGIVRDAKTHRATSQYVESETKPLSDEELRDPEHAAFDDATWRLLCRDGPEKTRKMFERVVSEWKDEERLWRLG